ncbi:MAG: hypothetical protein JW867_02380 [Candidatus Omnitrophica bacterium]|nr:hypothetical protein [Candidatus Omnitrophota bacterium]
MQKTVQKGFDFILLKRILFLCIFTILIGAVIYFFNIDFFLNMRLPEMTPEAKAANVVRSPKQVQYQQFLRKIEQRDIFAPAYKEEIEQAVKDPGPDKEKISKIIAGLRLVGIIAGEPLKVMIENTKDQQTFYLKKGENFLEGITIESIQDNSVILKANGESFELYL